jgi:hypothetical protein
MNFQAANRTASGESGGLVGRAIAYYRCGEDFRQWGLPNRKKGKWGKAGRTLRNSPEKLIAVAWGH